MHCALQRHRSNTQKFLDAGKGSRLKKSLNLKNFRTFQEDCEELSLIWRNSPQRFSFLTIVAVQVNGELKMIALPLQCCDHSSLIEPAGHVKINGLHFVSSPSISSFNVVPDIEQHPCDHVVVKISSESSNQSFLPGTDLKHSTSVSTNLSDMSIDNSKPDKSVKKTAKKSRKKGKNKKKHSVNIDSQAPANNYIENRDVLNSVSECRANESSISEGGDSTNNVVECSLIPDEPRCAVASYNELPKKETALPSFSREDDVSCNDSHSKRNKQVWNPKSFQTKRIFGKESNISVWQKVQKKPDNPVSDVTLKKSNIVDSSRFSKPTDKNQVKLKSTRKLKRKTSPGSTQEYFLHPSSNTERNEELSNHRKRFGGTLQISDPKDDLRTKGGVIDELVGSVENACNTVCATNVQTPVDENTPPFVSLSHSKSSVVQEPFIHVSEVDEGMHNSENGRLDQSSDSILQKWVPVGPKEPESSTCFDESDHSSLEEPLIDDCVLKNPTISSSVHLNNNSSCIDDCPIQILLKQNNTCFSLENENNHILDNDFVKIKEAVEDSCRVRIASECILSTAGFETFLCCASPTICESPTVSLGDVWKWYERHGSYGLEVRAEDHENSMRLGADRFAFRAYFVPSLSAVQLFGTRKIRLHGTIETLDQSDASELLFEYFEHELPQQRRPLFEKIKGLANGDGLFQAYGDPSKLISLDLRDLHPRSWYSVAWYPIYKIPDGNFRSAFLTYHSLCHFVFRSDHSKKAYESDVCFVSPVVGLQSYNTQSERWFELKRGAEGAGAGVLKERLRSLEHAACAMARSGVRKGETRIVNRHPDYEFFLSRSRGW